MRKPNPILYYDAEVRNAYNEHHRCMEYREGDRGRLVVKTKSTMLQAVICALYYTIMVVLLSVASVFLHVLITQDSILPIKSAGAAADQTIPAVNQNEAPPTDTGSSANQNQAINVEADSHSKQSDPHTVTNQDLHIESPPAINQNEAQSAETKENSNQNENKDKATADAATQTGDIGEKEIVPPERDKDTAVFETDERVPDSEYVKVGEGDLEVQEGGAKDGLGADIDMPKSDAPAPSDDPSTKGVLDLDLNAEVNDDLDMVPATPTVDVPGGKTLSAPAQEGGEEAKMEQAQVSDDTADHLTSSEPAESSTLPSDTHTDTDLSSPTPAPENEGEGERGEEQIVVPKEEDEIPSFDEWKAKMLREQEKVKHQEAQQISQNGGTDKGKLKKNRVNCAAASCGAKVLKHNDEATNAGFILSENRDQYMIQPCTAKKWFVVQLCDPVQVEVLELGNLELFSSLPKTFNVAVSDRYPTHNWEPLGTFMARDERGIQSFTVKDAPFAKYLRIEILSHYGTEHYCPLSTLRLYGLSVHEDTDEEQTDVVEDVATPPEKEEHPSGLFDIAQETVKSLVQNVLNTNGHAKPEGDSSLNKELEQQVIDLAGGGPSENGTANNETANATQATKPCTPEVSTGSPDKVVKNSKIPDKPEVPEPTVDSPFTTPQSEPSIIRLIESPQIPLSVLLEKCKFCEISDNFQECRMDRYSLCGYFSFVKFVYKTSCINHENATKRLAEKHSSVEMNATQSSHKTKPDGDPQGNSTEATGLETNSSHPVNLEENIPENTNKTHGENVADASTIVNSPEEPNKSKGDLSQNDITEDTKPEISNQDNIPSSQSGETTGDAPDVDEPLDLTSTPSVDIPIAKGDTEPHADQAAPMLGPDLVQIRPPADSDVISEPAIKGDAPKKGDTGEPDEVVVAGNSADENKGQKPQTKDKTTEKTSEPNTQAGENGLGNDSDRRDEELTNTKNEPESQPVIQADESSQENDEYGHSPQGDDVQVQRLGSGSKETTYMKLKNKIKELEINLNLSSTYLEELSQRYRKRMEDMYETLDKTINRLTVTSKNAEVQDQRQQERIGRLEAVVSDLNGTVSHLTQRLDLVHEEVIERHLYLLLIEFSIFLCVMAWCLNRQKDHYRERIRTVSENYFNATSTSTLSSSPSQTSPKGHRRGASVDLHTPSRQSKTSSSSIATTLTSAEDGMRKTGSENDITIIEPNSQLFSSEPSKGLEDLRKKKKKRKSSQVMMQQTKLSPQKPSHNSTQPHHNGVADKYTSSRGTTFNMSGTTSRVEETPVRRASTGTRMDITKSSSPPPVPELMYHSSNNQFSVLNVESPVITRSSTNGHSENINIKRISNEHHKTQSAVRRRLDVSGAKKNKTNSNEAVDSGSDKAQCLKNKHSVSTPVISRNGMDTHNSGYQERVEKPHSTSSESKLDNLNGTSISNDFERTSSFKWWVR